MCKRLAIGTGRKRRSFNGNAFFLHTEQIIPLGEARFIPRFARKDHDCSLQERMEDMLCPPIPSSSCDRFSGDSSMPVSTHFISIAHAPLAMKLA